MPSDRYIVRSPIAGYAIPRISVGEFLHDKLQRIISINPDKVALIDAINGQQLTYLELHQQALEAANGLLLGLPVPIESHDLCMFFADNYPQHVVMLLALAYLGVPITPSKPANGAYETCQHLDNSGARLLIISKNKLAIVKQILGDEKHAELLSRLKALIVLDADDESELPDSVVKHSKAPRQIVTFGQLRRGAGTRRNLNQIPHFRVNPEEDHHVIVYTSGSTGLPKGALQTHRGFIASVMAMLHKNAFRKNVGGVIDFIFPLGHISGTVFVINCLSSQMTLVMFGETLSHSLILQSVEKYKISVLIVTLALAADLLKSKDLIERYNLSSIKSAYFSGSRLPENVARGLIDRFGLAMYEVYGATEFMGCVTNNGLYVPGKIGQPLPNVEMKIVDLVSGDSLPANKAGEVCFRGPNCFAGYLNNEAATRATIIDGWYHSGDVGYYDEEGHLYITDRIKEMIKYKHWTVAPAEIEAFLQTHPAIVGACVVGVKHRSEGQHLRAYVQLAPGSSATEEEIVRFVRDNMGYQNRLNGGVRFVEDIPRISMGKIDRQHFKQLIKDEVLTEEAEK